MTTTSEMITRIRDPIQRYTRSWMMDSSTDDFGVRLGFASGSQFWVVGRAGVLGSCPFEVAAAAIAFEPVDAVERAWHAVPSGLTHYEVALHYRDRLVAWGERAFADADPESVASIDRLGRRVVEAAPGALGVLFAGWRRLPPPRSLHGRAALTVHLLRELRGAAHIAAVLTCGLTPLDAILAAPHPPPRTGPEYAERMGYRGPFRDPAEVRDQRMEAERLTEAMLQPYVAVLDAEERTVLSRAVEDVCSADPS